LGYLRTATSNQAGPPSDVESLFGLAIGGGVNRKIIVFISDSRESWIASSKKVVTTLSRARYVRSGIGQLRRALLAKKSAVVLS